MPELPEVEVIKRELAPEIEGHCFSRVEILCPEMVRRPSPDEFRHRLSGQIIREVVRRGKYLISRLESGEALLLHLRMSGSLALKPASAKVDPYTRAIFYVDNSLEIHFCDRRKLGTIELIKNENEVVGKLGPEPLEKSFTTEVLSQRLSRHQAPIKAVLLDQTALAGLGNMYADEALFSAHIHPLKRANTLSDEEIERLHRAIGEVLKAAIGNRGATISDYRDIYGQLGTHQFSFSVAHRGGEPCPICGTAIQRVPVRKRGTYFCPSCQRERAVVVLSICHPNSSVILSP
jgi:formamidopyrimidine-DNA glycosylase